MDFEKWPSIPRLRRGMVITEKIDGSNAQISVRPIEVGANTYDLEYDVVTNIAGEPAFVRAGSRTRWIKPKKYDNFGFAAWVHANADQLAGTLGFGRHYGEWYGASIQRTYGLDHRRFALFNTGRWRTENDEGAHVTCDAVLDLQQAGLPIEVVPVLHAGAWSDEAIERTLASLRVFGSHVAPFDRPEGVVILHVPSRTLFKQTLEHDDAPKTAAA